MNDAICVLFFQFNGLFRKRVGMSWDKGLTLHDFCRAMHQIGLIRYKTTGNGEPAVLVHHGIVRRWRCGSLVTQRPLPWLLSMTYTIVIVYDVTLLLSITYQFQISLGKKLTARIYG